MAVSRCIYSLFLFWFFDKLNQLSVSRLYAGHFIGPAASFRELPLNEKNASYIVTANSENNNYKRLHSKLTFNDLKLCWCSRTSIAATRGPNSRVTSPILRCRMGTSRCIKAALTFHRKVRLESSPGIRWDNQVRWYEWYRDTGSCLFTRAVFVPD